MQFVGLQLKAGTIYGIKSKSNLLLGLFRDYSFCLKCLQHFRAAKAERNQNLEVLFRGISLEMPHFTKELYQCFALTTFVFTAHVAENGLERRRIKQKNTRSVERVFS